MLPPQMLKCCGTLFKELLFVYGMLSAMPTLILGKGHNERKINND